MAKPFDRFRQFLAELKRRNVYKVAATYVVVAFVGLQAVDLLIPATTLPGWADELFLALVILGFPVSVVVAWAFEMTPQGVRRTPEAEGPRPGAGVEEGGVRRPLVSTAGVVAVLALLALAAGGWWLWRPFSPGQAEAAPERSVAVLPFDDLSAGGQEAGIGVGLTETIIARLSLVEKLSVISRTSVMPYQETDLGLPAIADSLGVEHVVEGSVQRSGDSVRIVAQLIRADTDRHLWAQTFDRPFSDIFRIQSEVASRIAEGLEAELTAETRERMEERPTESPAAYDLYLRGVELSDRSRTDNRAAVELLRQTIGMDSTFALAYAGLANAYMHRAQDFGYPHAWYDSALATARRAVEIDPELARGHKEVATALQNLGKLKESIEAFRQAIALRPGYGEAMHNLGVAYAGRGQYAEALEWYWKSLPSQPNSPYPLASITRILYLFGEDAATRAWIKRLLEAGGPRWEVYRLVEDVGRGRIKAAGEHLRQLQEWNADAARTLVWSGILVQIEDRPKQAVEHYRRAYQRRPEYRGGGPSPRLRLAQTLQGLGREAEARTLLAEARQWNRSLIEGGSEASSPRLRLAAAHLLQDEREAAYRWLDSAYAAGYRWHPGLLHDPIWRRVREQDLFQKLLTRVEDDLREQRAEAVAWARGEGLNWPPLPGAVEESHPPSATTSATGS